MDSGWNLVQWGRGSRSSGYGYEVVKFPVAFTSQCFMCVHDHLYPSAKDASDYRAVHTITATSAAIGYEYNWQYIAIGI